MLTLYERIENLCALKGVNITDMCKASGASRGSLTDLKKGRKKTLKAETLAKIASFFEVSVDYLLTGEQQKEKAPTKAKVEEDPLSQVSFALFGTHDKIDEGILDDVRAYARFKLEQQRKAAEEKK